DPHRLPSEVRPTTTLEVRAKTPLFVPGFLIGGVCVTDCEARLNPLSLEFVLSLMYESILAASVPEARGGWTVCGVEARADADVNTCSSVRALDWRCLAEQEKVDVEGCSEGRRYHP
ncbi:MAG: hypothetical protein RBU37_28205, partial [Myxococcota bacterium]|nr:hypothetical protein [Myxococcota bacterium]